MRYTHLPEKFERNKQIAHYLDENGKEFAIPVKVKNGKPIFSAKIKAELDRRSNPHKPPPQHKIPKTLSLWGLIK